MELKERNRFHPLRLNTVRGTKTFFQPLKGKTSTPSLLYWSLPPPPQQISVSTLSMHPSQITQITY